MQAVSAKAHALQSPVRPLSEWVKELNGGSLLDQIDGLENYQAVKRRLNDIFLSYLVCNDGQELQDDLKYDVMHLLNAFQQFIDLLYLERHDAILQPIRELQNQISNGN